ncbi:hypothetical protein [Streptomyces sp. NPDC051364]
MRHRSLAVEFDPTGKHVIALHEIRSGLVYKRSKAKWPACMRLFA